MMLSLPRFSFLLDSTIHNMERLELVFFYFRVVVNRLIDILQFVDGNRPSLHEYLNLIVVDDQLFMVILLIYCMLVPKEKSLLFPFGILLISNITIQHIASYQLVRDIRNYGFNKCDMPVSGNILILIFLLVEHTESNISDLPYPLIDKEYLVE